MREEWVIKNERLMFFSNAMLIKSLCNRRAFDRVLHMRDVVLARADVRPTNLAFGYKLVVQFGLWGLLDHLIRYPDLLALEGEPHLFRWWRLVQGDDGTALKAAICQPDTDFVRIVSGIDDLVVLYRRAGVSWDDIAEANKRAELVADELLEIARVCPPSWPIDDQPVEDVELILQKHTVSLLHDAWVEGVESSAFRYSMRKSTEWKPIELPGQSMFDVQTHRDPMRVFPEYKPSEFNPGWIVGKLAATVVSLQETDQWNEDFGDPDRLIRSNSDPSRCWEAGNRMFEEVHLSDFTGPEYGLQCPHRLPAKILPSLTASVSLAKSEERLAALLGSAPKLVASRDSRSVLNVETLASGLACTLPGDEPIDIIRIVHGEKGDDVNPVSLAVLLPLPTLLGDRSEWWVFDQAYRTQEFDPKGDRCVSRINESVGSLGKRINWIDMTDVPVEYLLDLCDSRSFRRLLGQFKELERKAKDIRGAIPELLTAQLLFQAGYNPVRPSLKLTFPGGKKRELDVVGIRLSAAGADCKIIEVKGRSDSQHALERYIERFHGTVQLADVHREVIQEAVGCEQRIQAVSGLFVSMAKDFRVADQLKKPGVEYWNFDRFVAELSQAGFSDRYINLLQESLVVWEDDIADI